MKDLDFQHAADVLRGVLRVSGDDHRLEELMEAAEALLAELHRLRDQWGAKLESVTAAAMEADRKLDHHAAIASLRKIPDQLMTEALRRLQARSEACIDEQQELRRALKEAVRTKDYTKLGIAVDALSRYQPGDVELATLAGQVSSLLINRASASCRDGRFAQAFEQLSAVPAVRHETPEFQKLKVLIDDAVWITDQIARSPFATPTLGMLARRLAAFAPDNERAAKAVRELSARVRNGSEDPLSLYAPWADLQTGWGGARVSIVGRTRRIGWRDQKELNQNPTRFGVALGLALQGLGESQFDGHQAKARKFGGLMARLARNEKSAWGVDVGASVVRAIRLERVGDGINIADVIWLPLERSRRQPGQATGPGSRGGVEYQLECNARLRELASRIGEDGIPVWANLPAGDVLGRFLALPPLPDKKLVKLLEKELATQFPLPADQLITASRVTGLGADGSPRAVLLASKKTVVHQREKLFADAGLKITGIQSDPIALHNFAACEWADLLASPQGLPSGQPAIAMLDCGASGTTCYVATSGGFWFRHFHFGGDDLTIKLAAVCNLTHQQAEAMRIQPANLAPLSSGMEAVERRIQDFACRFGQTVPQASQSLGEIELRHIFCIGGTALQHGWARHAIAAEPTPR